MDVTALVVDKKGNPVIDLKKEDFEIYDEGKRQPIRMFASPATLAPLPIEPPIAPALPTALPTSPRTFSNHADQTSRSNPTILRIDEGPAKWEEELFARGRIVRLLKQLPPGEQIGLYAPVPYGVGSRRAASTVVSTSGTLLTSPKHSSQSSYTHSHPPTN